ncbi:nitrate reductase [Erythrobacter mangrovi]|uniref:Molybdopterin-dependent oxidoreductase n=1 Tax=Erythrobacter mangrovi TaxID=2739433 RepID=A0A7D4CE27_9SPHN|nr:nitrate reductase [Erythrobacter mangrovi]QKG72189.1 molybdopterin-dependent oxidoreductase [Erythrobacter mangrovi]
MAAILTTCAYCGVGCGIAAKVVGDRKVSIAGDKDHPANRGALCSKGIHLGETVGLEGRLLHPMIGEERVEWDRALDEVAGRMRECVETYGPDSVALYVSGQLLTEDYYVANKLAKGFIGTGNIDTNSRLCMASAVAAHQRAFGEDVVPCSYEDLDCAELIVLVGSNTAWCHPVIWQRIERAREQHGTRLVVIDPRRTETAERADLHLAVRPDGDVALFNALLGEMLARGLVDQDFLAAHCTIPAQFWDSLDCSPGVPAEVFSRFADMVAESPRTVTLFSQGANQSVGGTDKCNAITNLHLATGRINRPGAGPFSITGQPNAMGGREVGGLSSMLAVHLGFSLAERADVATFWKTDHLCKGPGLKAIDLFRAVHDGRIKFLWIMGTNPAVSMPDAGFVREALARCPTLVVSEIMAETDTSRFAHVRLPALGWGEKDGTVTNSERRISRQRALFTPPGEARADWQIICEVARLTGFEEHFSFDSAADVFREYAAMSALSGAYGKLFDLTAWADCSDAEYDTMRPFRWGGRHPCAARFPAEGGKARLVRVTAPVTPSQQPDFPLRLNTGRYRDQWHTMTRTGLSPKLSIHRREPRVEVHPDVASEIGLLDGGLARVGTPFGESIYRVELSEAVRPSEIFVPMHWSDGLSAGGRTGRLVQPTVDPHSGQPGFKNTAARIAPFRPEWRAFLAGRVRIRPTTDYWSASRVEKGWITELAGMGSVDFDYLMPPGERSEASDMQAGMKRLAVSAQDGSLEAVLFITRSGTLPPREWISDQLGTDFASVTEWLAGRPLTPLQDCGPTVCVCHGVGELDILSAIDAGAEDVATISKCTKAGTNCGSCRPIISRLLDGHGARLTEVR